MRVRPRLSDLKFPRDGATEVVVFASLLEGSDGFLSDNGRDVLFGYYLHLIVDMSDKRIVFAEDVTQTGQVLVQDDGCLFG